jgi:RNA polymerase sigma-70 factor (TIGR02960 family)
MTRDTEATRELIAKAQAGNGSAFAILTDPYRRTLLRHCYRMLGSYQDAEDVLQETLFAAWQGIGRFESRASVRTWLYTIATNRCLNAFRSIRRRPAQTWDIASVIPPEPTRLTEVVWLEPFPDEAALGADGRSTAPDILYERTEDISLAFVTALQLLPPRQLAVLLLRDVVGFHADEVAGILETTIDAVNSTLKRARANLSQRRARNGDEIPSARCKPADAALVARFVRAWEAADVKDLVSMLTDDVLMSMPPMPYIYQGPVAVGVFCNRLFDAGRRFELVLSHANGQPAFGVYLRTAEGDRPGVGLYVLTVAGDRIQAMTRFESRVLPWFGLPTSLS